MHEIIISIKPYFVDKILCGEKTVELRTKRANLLPGTRMWIYSTLPRGEICAFAYVEYVYTENPEIIWAQYGKEIAITEEEFWEYVGERNEVTIIKMSKANTIGACVTLKNLQEVLGGFYPPQFFIRLNNCSPIRSLLCRAG